MPAKMRAVSLTGFQRCPVAISLRIRIPCRRTPRSDGAYGSRSSCCFLPIVSPDGGTIASWRPLQPLESMGSFRSHGAGDECGHGRSRQDNQRYSMEGKGRFIFPVLISALIVFVVSAVVTFTNIGLRVDFVPRWLKAFITGWPVAAVLAFFAVPHVRRATEIIVRFIDG